MKMVLLDGALFNQVTQYVFARCVELATGETVLLDDSFFRVSSNIPESIKSQEKTGYHLGKFKNASPHLLSEYFTPDVWAELLQAAEKRPQIMGGSHMPQILKDYGLNFFMIAEPPSYRFDGFVARMPFYHHIKEMLLAQGDVYYWGYFTHGGWFMDHEALFRKELELPPLASETDRRMAEEISHCSAVCIHVRRGSYSLLNMALPADYYKQAIRSALHQFRKKSDLHFYVFSDDIPFCRENAEAFGFNLVKNSLTYGQSVRTFHDNHCDSQLMSLCKGMILSNSVYSYYSALLNPIPDKWVINPLPGRGIF